MKKLWQKLKRFWKWLVVLTVGSVAVANFAIPNGGVPPVDNRAIGSDEIVLQGEESLFAEFDADGNVLRVIVVNAEILNTGKWGDPKNWVRTYVDGRRRFNYAGKGRKYDKIKDAFIPSKPRPDTELNILDWTLDTETFRWKAVK